MNFRRCSKPFKPHFIFSLKKIWFFFKANPLNHMTDAKNGPNGDLKSSYSPWLNSFWIDSNSRASCSSPTISLTLNFSTTSLVLEESRSSISNRYIYPLECKSINWRVASLISFVELNIHLALTKSYTLHWIYSFFLFFSWIISSIVYSHCFEISAKY